MSNFEIVKNTAKIPIQRTQDDQIQNGDDCIDYQVRSLPRECYNETLIRTTKNNDKYLMAYRHILLDRAKSVEEYPKRD